MPRGPCTPSDFNDNKMSWNSIIKECCQLMYQARYQKGPIILLESQNIIKEILRNYRDNEILISKFFIYEIVKQLESDDFCSRIHESLVVLIIEIILQSEQSRSNERGIYLLAISLFNESTTQENCGKYSPRRRKEYVAIKSLPLLINCLISPKNNYTMKRSIGVLCHELYRGLIENYEFTSIDLDNNRGDCRQQLGRLIIEEPDKIVKIICAQIVKDLYNKGARAVDLFPRYYDKLVYLNFLLAIQEEKTWYDSFQSYLSNISKQIDSYQEQVDKIFPLTSIILNPYHSLSCGNQINYMVLDQKSITILVPPTSTKISQIIEISLDSIGRLRNYIYNERSRPTSAIFEIQFKEGPGSSNLLNGKEIQLINTRLQLPSQDGKLFQNHIARLLPEIKVEVNTELDRIPDSQELPISYLSTHCSSCEILVRRGSWSDKFFDQNCRYQFIEADDSFLNFRSEIEAKMVKFMDRNLVIQKPNTPHEKTKPRAKQPLVSSRRSFGDFQVSNHSLKSKLLEHVSEVEDLSDLNGQEEIMKPKVRASNLITALPTPSSNIKLQSDIIEKISLPVIIEDSNINAETGAENIKQAIALKKKVSMSRKTHNRNKTVIKKFKKTGERKLSPTYTTQNMQSKTEKKIPLKNEKFVTESSQISIEPCISHRGVVQSDQISNQIVNKTEKSQITHPIQPPSTVSDRDILQQQDAIALGFVAENSLKDQESCEYYNMSSKEPDQPQVENISIEDKSVLRNETLELQEKLSLLSKYDIALIKGLNSMMDDIDNDYESNRRKDLHQITPKISIIQSKDPKCDENVNLTSQSKINSLERVFSTENLQKDIFILKLTTKEMPVKISAQKQIYEDDAMRLSETADLSPDITLNRKDNCELGKPKSIVSDISKDFTAPKPSSEPIITPKSKVEALDSSKKRTSSYEDKGLKKQCKNDFRITPALNKNDFSKSSMSDRLYGIEPNIEQGENFEEKQDRDLKATIDKNQEQTEIEYNETKKLPPCNSLGSNEDKNNNFIPKSHPLKQDSLYNEFTQKPKLISFGTQGARNQGKIRKSNQISPKPKSVKSNVHECKNKSLPKKPWNKTLVEKINVDSHFESTKSLSMRPKNDTCKSRNHTSPVTVGIFSLNPSSATKNPNFSKDVCEPSYQNSTSPAYRKASPKPGFQGLKVTDEGSPISKKDIRQIYKRNLDTKTRESRYKKKEANDNFQDKRIFRPFNSRISLAKRLRAGSKSPGIRRNNLSLYETTDNIDFTDMDSREVISQKAMHDPFRTQDSKSQRQNHFLELLQGTLTKNSGVVANISDQVFLSKFSKPCQPSTLEVSEKNNLPDGSSTKIKQRNEKWNMAIRTRYEGLYDSVHEIADDLITRLVREEDRMKLLIDQYSRNGAKVINYLSTYHAEEQALILERLETVKADILNKESKALTTLTKVYDNIQSNSMIDTLSVWEKKKNEIKVMITENRNQHNNYS
ncbi:putative powdery mildew-specific protein [Erysiphe neolycopersici]|uniref:Putative powdery mildew-specific protein n=1 Tax=Erysiphe neolycopersici TaxID=212602 RepID=A0A420HP58_9PEZI|nr:putative powdery mildew-specific protein [Erysiphe neolycopersici]